MSAEDITTLKAMASSLDTKEANIFNSMDDGRLESLLNDLQSLRDDDASSAEATRTAMAGRIKTVAERAGQFTSVEGFKINHFKIF